MGKEKVFHDVKGYQMEFKEEKDITSWASSEFNPIIIMMSLRPPPMCYDIVFAHSCFSTSPTCDRFNWTIKLGADGADGSLVTIIIHCFSASRQTI
jgi:hypothetical protein